MQTKETEIAASRGAAESWPTGAALLAGAVLLLAPLVPSSSAASGRVLAIDDIGSGEPHFSWQELWGGKVALSATVAYRTRLDDNSSEYHSSGALGGFRREARDVYYVGNGDGAPVLCGRTQGFFLPGPEFSAACRVSVEPEQLCVGWYGADDCIAAVTRYRVFLTIRD